MKAYSVMFGVGVSILFATLFTPPFGNQREYLVSLRPLGRRRRFLAFLVIGIGIVTFLVPLIGVKPSVGGKTQWSPFDLAWQMRDARDIGGATARMFLPNDIIAVYLLMVVALGVLLFSSSSKVLVAIGTIGGIESWEAWKWDNIDFQRMFYGSLLIGHVQFGELMLALLAAMVGLVAIGFYSDLDVESEPGRREGVRLRGDSPEPEFPTGEILPPQEKRRRP